MIKALEKKIRKARLAYYNGDPIMSDRAFDELMDRLRDAAPNSRVLKEVGAKPMGTTGKHSIPMGSLKEAKTAGEMRDWMAGIEGGFLVMAKVDGLSIALDYERGKLVQALTRGNGREGEDVTANVRQMQNVLEEIPGFTGTLRGEAFLPVRIFQKRYAENYANPRNTAAGIVRRHSGEGAEDVELRYFYMLQKDWGPSSRSEMLKDIQDLGLTPVSSFSVKTFKAFLKRWERVVEGRYDNHYEMDGVVVYVENVNERDQGDPFLPDDALVYKFEPDVKRTIVTEIEHVAGTSGRVNPRVHVKPVKVGGVTVTHATGNNYPWLEAMNVGVGAEVEVSRRGDTIPAIERVLKKGDPLQIPTSCPTCDTSTVRDGAYLKCNNMLCEAKDSGRVSRWLDLIEIKGVGKKMLSKLVDLGVRRPYMLYGQTLEWWTTNFGKNGQKILRQLLDKKVVKPELILAAHVSNVGRRRFKAILDAGFSLEEIMILPRSEFVSVDGIGEEVGRIIEEGFSREESNVRHLLNHITVEAPVSKKGTLEGWALKFTGKMQHKRRDLESLAESKGGRIGWKKGFKNVLVIADPNSTSSKAQAARKAGHELISEEEFLVAAEA